VLKGIIQATRAKTVKKVEGKHLDELKKLSKRVNDEYDYKRCCFRDKRDCSRCAKDKKPDKKGNPTNYCKNHQKYLRAKARLGRSPTASEMALYSSPVDSIDLTKIDEAEAELEKRLAALNPNGRPIIDTRSRDEARSTIDAPRKKSKSSDEEENGMSKAQKDLSDQQAAWDVYRSVNEVTKENAMEQWHRFLEQREAAKNKPKFVSNSALNMPINPSTSFVDAPRSQIVPPPKDPTFTYWSSFQAHRSDNYWDDSDSSNEPSVPSSKPSSSVSSIDIEAISEPEANNSEVTKVFGQYVPLNPVNMEVDNPSKS